MKGFDPDKESLDAYIARIKERKPKDSSFGERIEIPRKYFQEKIHHNEINSKTPDSSLSKPMPPSSDITAALAEIDRITAQEAAELRRALAREPVDTAAFRRDVPDYLEGLKPRTVAELRPELVDPFREAMDMLRRRETEGAAHLRRALEGRPFDFAGFDTARQPTPPSAYDAIIAELKSREKTPSKFEPYKIIKNNNPEEITFDRKRPSVHVAELRDKFRSPFSHSNDSPIVRAALCVVRYPGYVAGEARAICDSIFYNREEAANDRYDRHACRTIAECVEMFGCEDDSNLTRLERTCAFGKVTAKQVIGVIFVGKVRNEYVRLVSACLKDSM